MQRRTFIANTGKTTLGLLAATGGLSTLGSCSTSKKSAGKAVYQQAPGFTQKPLPYAFAALAPHIDAATMEVHYTKHAAGYQKNLAEAMAEEKPAAKTLEDLLGSISKQSLKMRNNAGGHYNHECFWQWMTPGGKAPSEPFKAKLEASFTSMADFKTKFADAGLKRFGSGWAWLVLDANKNLQIGSTPNQDNPLMDVSELKGYPLLGLDVWEHAYYLKYQNKRADYIAAWWNLVNWAEVEARYQFALGS
ncbi:MAG: superoxide dismutase [Bacteroidetes bacterium]|nr:MAG: superoxide dismutase [Bacteroidota bacterium]